MFPWERPSTKAYRLWSQAVRQIVPAEGITDRLGPFIHDAYKVWEWQYNEEEQRIWHVYDDKMDIYTWSDVGRRWEMVQEEVPLVEGGQPCHVRMIG
jgi:hypothetical protein